MHDTWEVKYLLRNRAKKYLKCYEPKILGNE